MMRKNFMLLSILGMIVMITGCSLGNQQVTLATPPSAEKSDRNWKSVFLKVVTDDRVFEVKPTDPSIPSANFEGTEEELQAFEAKAFARVRHPMGKALNNVLLEEGYSVSAVMRETIKSAFRDMGYEIIEDESGIKPDTQIIETSIEQFWCWVEGNGLYMRIVTAMEISPGDHQVFEIEIEHHRNSMSASTGKFKRMAEESLVKYSDKLKRRYKL